MRPQALAEIEGIARNPGFATPSGEPREALEEIVKIFDQEKAVAAGGRAELEYLRDEEIRSQGKGTRTLAEQLRRDGAG